MNIILLAIGIAVGYGSQRWANRAAAVLAICVVIALMWGALLSDGIAGGTIWALINLGVGVAIAAGVRWTLDRAGDGPIGRN